MTTRPPADPLPSPASSPHSDAPMVSWARFAAEAPDLAEAGRRLLAVPGFGFGYLATVSRAGAPRLHPINPIFANGHLVAYIVPSPKLADLRSGRPYALHSTGSPEVDDEFLVAGRAAEVTDPSLGAAALAASPFVPGSNHVLVEFGLERALWGHYEPGGGFPPRYLHWRSGEGATTTDRSGVR